MNFDTFSTTSADPVDHRAESRPLGGGLKRGFDVAFALVALLSTVLLFALFALMIRLSSKGPVFFVHWRVGHGGRMFPCLKFRTMHVGSDRILAEHLARDPEARRHYEIYRKLRNDPRIIPGIGHVLRRTSLDELPQFLNVLRGEMSVVGPRPVTREEIPLYGESVVELIRSRPGITGLWQVSGRNELSFADRVAIDRCYIRNWSLWADLKILVRTVGALASRQGAY